MVCLPAVLVWELEAVHAINTLYVHGYTSREMLKFVLNHISFEINDELF